MWHIADIQTQMWQIFLQVFMQQHDTRNWCTVPPVHVDIDALLQGFPSFCNLGHTCHCQKNSYNHLPKNKWERNKKTKTWHPVTGFHYIQQHAFISASLHYEFDVFRVIYSHNILWSFYECRVVSNIFPSKTDPFVSLHLRECTAKSVKTLAW